MDYLSRITEIRNDMHREIVHEATSKLLIKYPDYCDEGIMELNQPIRFTCEVNNPYDGYSCLNLKIIGVECNTGELVCHDEDGYDVHARYNNLSTDTLVVLYHNIINKQNFTIKPNLFV